MEHCSTRNKKITSTKILDWKNVTLICHVELWPSDKLMHCVNWWIRTIFEILSSLLHVFKRVPEFLQHRACRGRLKFYWKFLYTHRNCGWISRNRCLHWKGVCQGCEAGNSCRVLRDNLWSRNQEEEVFRSRENWGWAGNRNSLPLGSKE